MPTPKTSAAIPSDVDTRTDEERAQEEAAAAAARDEEGASLVAAEGDGAIAAGAIVLTPTDTPELQGSKKDWADVLIVANAPGRMPDRKGRKIIVAEARSQPDEDDNGAGQDLDASYPKGADAYIGHARVDAPGQAGEIFPDAGEAPVFLIGQNVKQFSIGGVSRQQGFLSVGPGSAVYAAANLALQQGAKTVEIHGLTDHDKATVGKHLDLIKGEFDSLTY